MPLLPSASALTAPLTIVVPVLNEAATLELRLQALQALRTRGARVVVVDGGSTDRTQSLSCNLADLTLASPRGRGAQMNAGAAASRFLASNTVDTAEILLFLHADTALPKHADRCIQQAVQGGAVWGRFDVRIDSPRPVFRAIEGLMNLRSRWSGVATGDQAVFVQRAAFEAVGGFEDIALMEDIALSRALCRLSRPACLRQRVTTSARRWERYGVWRTVLLMWRLRAAYFLGADPAQLALQYGYQPRQR